MYKQDLALNNHSGLRCCKIQTTYHYYQHDTFFYAKFHSNILSVYILGSYQDVQFFFILDEYLDIIHVRKLINLFLLFLKIYNHLCTFIVYNWLALLVWKILPLRIFASARICPHAVKSTFQFSIAFVIKFMTSSNILHIIYLLIRVFTSALADGNLSLEIERQQVSSSLQDPSQYSGCFQ